MSQQATPETATVAPPTEGGGETDAPYSAVPLPSPTIHNAAESATESAVAAEGISLLNLPGSVRSPKYEYKDCCAHSGELAASIGKQRWMDRPAHWFAIQTVARAGFGCMAWAVTNHYVNKAMAGYDPRGDAQNLLQKVGKFVDTNPVMAPVRLDNLAKHFFPVEDEGYTIGKTFFREFSRRAFPFITMAWAHSASEYLIRLADPAEGLDWKKDPEKGLRLDNIRPMEALKATAYAAYCTFMNGAEDVVADWVPYLLVHEGMTKAFTADPNADDAYYKRLTRTKGDGLPPEPFSKFNARWGVAFEVYNATSYYFNLVRRACESKVGELFHEYRLKHNDPEAYAALQAERDAARAERAALEARMTVWDRIEEAGGNLEAEGRKHWHHVGKIVGHMTPSVFAYTIPAYYGEHLYTEELQPAADDGILHGMGKAFGRGIKSFSRTTADAAAVASGHAEEHDPAHNRESDASAIGKNYGRAITRYWGYILTKKKLRVEVTKLFDEAEQSGANWLKVFDAPYTMATDAVKLVYGGIKGLLGGQNMSDESPAVEVTPVEDHRIHHLRQTATSTETHAADTTLLQSRRTTLQPQATLMPAMG